MPSAKSLQNKITKAIKKVGPMSRTAVLRVATITGGDSLIGHGSTLTNTDTVFDPQPVYRQLGHRQAMYLSTGSLKLVSDDYHFTFPVGANTEADFQGSETFLVLTDANGEERLKILYVNTESFGGADVVIFVFARSIGH